MSSFENSLKLYDFAALVPVVKGAGGLITDWQGGELDMKSDGSVLAAGDRAGLEDPQNLMTRPHLIRPSYLKAVQAYLSQLQKGCEANRVDYVRVDTSRPLTETLSEYLARRLKVRRI